MATRSMIAGAMLVFLPLCGALANEPQTLNLESLSAKLANDVVLAAVADCTRRGYKVSAAVVGREGNLLAFLRNPLSGPHTINVSQLKAFSAASLQAPTSQMKSRPDLNFVPGLLLIVGGVPINVGDKFYGGAAVAGADPEVDEKCAEFGVAAIRDALEFSQ